MKKEDFVGTNVDKVETAKSLVVKHKFWLGVQCHPEFNSKWETPSYYFTELLRLAKNDCKLPTIASQSNLQPLAACAAT